jgi:hypothetical protein
MGRRPSASTVIATLALCVAVSGGTAFAVAKLDGDDIQKRSIPANRVEPNALTGKQIREGTLRPVPMAKRVEQLQVTGVQGRPGNYVRLNRGETAEVFSAGGLAIVVSCADVAAEPPIGPATRVTVSATSRDGRIWDTRQGGGLVEGPIVLYTMREQNTRPGVSRTEPTTVMSTSGRTLMLGTGMMGTNVLGSDCMFSASAVS